MYVSHKRFLIPVMMGVFLNGHAPVCIGQQAAPVDRSRSVSFYPIVELTKPRGAQPSLRGAVLAKPTDWPASFYSTHPEGSCTSTMVGPRALLTAAHCVPSQSTVVIRLAGTVYKGTCTQSDLYLPDTRDGQSSDWALCLMNNDVPVSQFETINSDASRLKANTTLLLTGFGCTQPTGTGGNDGNYRIGEAQIIALPNANNNDITMSGEVGLCFGDSGGGAFLYLDPNKRRRIQVSVNSRVQVLSDGRLGNESYLSSLSTPAAQQFLKGWSTEHNAVVCGISTAATRCGK